MQTLYITIERERDSRRRFERSATLTLVAFAIALWCGARYDLVASGTGLYFGGWCYPHRLARAELAAMCVLVVIAVVFFAGAFRGWRAPKWLLCLAAGVAVFIAAAFGAAMWKGLP